MRNSVFRRGCGTCFVQEGADTELFCFPRGFGTSLKRLRIIHVQLVHSVSYQLSQECASTCPFPAHVLVHTHLDRDLEYADRSTNAQVRGKSVEQNRIRVRSDSTAYGTSQLVMRQGSNGKRRMATKSVARLCVANAAGVLRSHTSQCCLGYASIELTIFYSVNTGDVTTWVTENVVGE